MAATQPMMTLEPFAECFEVTTTDTTAQDVWAIPRGTIITRVLCEVVTAATGSANNIIVGDDDDDNGYILAASICGTTVGTIYGDAVAELGAYLEAGGTGTHAGSWKVYTAVGKEIKIDQSAAASTEAVVRIYIFGYRYKDSA